MPELICIKYLKPSHRRHPSSPKLAQEELELPLVVSSLVCLPILEIRRPELSSPSQQIIQTGRLKRFEIQQMAHVLLNRPGAGKPANHQLSGKSLDLLLQAHRGASQTLDDAWEGLCLEA
jgi:hypothetical protein